jgi:hypothetical protein
MSEVALVLPWCAGYVVLLVLSAVLASAVSAGERTVERVGQIVEGYRANRETDREIDARMNVPLPDARTELSDPTSGPPYIAPVLGVRIGTRHPDPVQHVPAYEPAHAAPGTAAGQPSYAGFHRRAEAGVITREFDRIVGAEFDHQPSYVGSAA